MKRLLAALAFVAAPAAASAQVIRLDTELPRVMVMVADESGTATGALNRFLSDAGFTVVDPALAQSASQREHARAALAGDNSAAVLLGRDLGAHVIILGNAPAEAVPSPSDASMQTGTANLNLRALRLDDGRVVGTASTSARALDASPLAARTGALRRATESMLQATSLIGDVVTDWESKPWDDDEYWRKDPPAPAGAAQPAPSPVRVAILQTDVGPDTTTIGTSRGIKVLPRTNGELHARIRGVVSPASASVQVAGAAAVTRALTPEEAKRFGLSSAGALFEADYRLAAGQDTLRVVARADDAVQELLVRPRIGRQWAVIIGVSKYQDRRIAPLAYADDDARAMYDFLRSPRGGAVPESQIRLLLDEQATTAALRDAFFVFLQQAQPEDMVLIYVAGHGGPDAQRPSNLYLMTYDTDVDVMATSAFPMWDVKTALHRHIAAERVIVLADACHSAGTQDNANVIADSFSELLGAPRRLALSAAATNELSHEGPQWGGGHGVFTFHLLEALQGAADSDRDGIVTFAEVSAHVSGLVARDTRGRQTPTRSGVGDLVLAAPPSGG